MILKRIAKSIVSIGDDFFAGKDLQSSLLSAGRGVWKRRTKALRRK